MLAAGFFPNTLAFAQAPAAPAPVAAPALPAPAEQAVPEPPASSTSLRSLLQTLYDGGPVMIPIGICSIILVIYIFERLLNLRAGLVIPGPFVERFIQQLREGTISRDEAMQLCQENGSIVAIVFLAAVKKWGRTQVEVEQAIIDDGERAANQLRSGLRVFSAIATLGPLLGLLGTVFGMIASFNNIAYLQAIGRPQLLAAGIAESLITTASGLLIAVPAYVAYYFFASRADTFITEIDSLGQQVIECICCDSDIRTSAGAKAARSGVKKAA